MHVYSVIRTRFFAITHFQLFLTILKYFMGHFLSFSSATSPGFIFKPSFKNALKHVYFIVESRRDFGLALELHSTGLDGSFSKLMGLWRMAPCLPNHCIILYPIVYQALHHPPSSSVNTLQFALRYLFSSPLCPISSTKYT